MQTTVTIRRNANIERRYAAMKKQLDISSQDFLDWKNYPRIILFLFECGRVLCSGNFIAPGDGKLHSFSATNTREVTREEENLARRELAGSTFENDINSTTYLTSESEQDDIIRRMKEEQSGESKSKSESESESKQEPEPELPPYSSSSTTPSSSTDHCEEEEEVKMKACLPSMHQQPAKEERKKDPEISKEAEAMWRQLSVEKVTEKIRLEAYFQYEARKKETGRSESTHEEKLDDWTTAEWIVLSRLIQEIKSAVNGFESRLECEHQVLTGEITEDLSMEQLKIMFTIERGHLMEFV
eukprot:MONOS_8675.1-p1 / transcript=MONOS_8675.1 / gene=MONOS_8675 / organism=Monocercomonoides_exilis_PA203 / gene_product=unspecified product / transcript_product=unspecified product / location=Mono_scaffold00333:52115-53481(-) / protein_length=299 / sequence_SO=supercontig / SO=protein_coding / is_pseudo=false